MGSEQVAFEGDFQPGAILDGRYLIEAELGEGGIGKVYRARHIRLDRPVAVKVLLTRHRDQTSLQARFEREAQALSSLSHPNIVTVTDFGIADGIPFLVMDLVEGRDLSKVLSEGGALPPARAFSVGKQILRSLAYAHERGVVHRDLKPANVLLRVLPDGSDHAVVLDFGLAKFIGGSGQSADLTHTGAILGSPAYMSPEQAGGGETDARTDVYAMGLIFFELLSGRRPFTSKRVTDLLRDHLVSTPPRLSEVVSGMAVDPRLDALLMRAMAKSPEERFLNAAQMLSAIEELGESSARWVQGPPVLVDAQATRAGRPGATPSGGVGVVGGDVAHLATMAVSSGSVSVSGTGSMTGAVSGTYGGQTTATQRSPVVALFVVGGFVALVGGILAVALSGGRTAGPVLDANAGALVGPSEKPSAGEATQPKAAEADPVKPANPTAGRGLLEAVTGAAAAGRDPWSEVPSDLRELHARVMAGRPLQRAQIRRVRDYGRANPKDPRSFLLLGRSYTLERSLSYALPEYQQALVVDPTVRADRFILRDLLEAARSQSQFRNAQTLIKHYWGKDAASAIDKELAGDLRPEERHRLEVLKSGL